MEWNLLDKISAKADTDNWNRMDELQYRSLMENWDPTKQFGSGSDYTRLFREGMQQFEASKINVFKTSDLKTIPSDSKNAYKYLFDLDLGLRFYFLLQRYGFTIREASIDKIWSYLDVRNCFC